VAGFTRPAYNPLSFIYWARLRVLELVVAAADNDVIGRLNRLPWHLPSDLKHFKALTTGKHVLMGRKTYESIGKPLPNRTNLVMSRGAAFQADGCTAVGSVQASRDLAGAAPLMIIGGAEIYRLCLPDAERIHLTLVHTVIPDGDTFFPEWRSPEWREIDRALQAADERNTLAHSFITLERRV
jgi:dihydrofolate reductase